MSSNVEEEQKMGVHGIVSGLVNERTEHIRETSPDNSRRRPVDALAVIVVAARSGNAGGPEHVVRGDVRVEREANLNQESAESSRTSKRANSKGSHAGRRRRWTEAVRTEAMKGEGRCIQSLLHRRHETPQEES
jgi:hypothetical protein